MKYEIKHRYSGDVIYIADINCDFDTEEFWKKRLAVLDAIRNVADLRDVDFRDVDFRDVDFRNASLIDANLRCAKLPGSPKIDNIHSKVYQAASQENALDMSAWHICETTHCRAGWVVTLAGQYGKNLEDDIGTPAAAALIYMASDPSLEQIPDFYCSNEEALEDMKRLADMEDKEKQNV